LDESKKPNLDNDNNKPKLDNDNNKPKLDKDNNNHNVTLNKNETEKPLSNETAIDLELGGKNDSDVISDLLSNATGNVDVNGGNNSVSKILLPSKIQKVRLTVIGFTGKPVHTFNLTEDQVLYQMKVFWGEPDSWQDIGWRPSDRVYELFCWLATNGGFGRDLFRGNLSASLITNSQWYAFPEMEDESKGNISVNCGLRAVNGAGKTGDWSFSEAAPVRDAPVFLRGFENVNVRGWTKQEVVRLVQNQKRLDSVHGQAKPQAKPVQSAKAAQPAQSAKSKSKNRRAS